MGPDDLRQQEFIGLPSLAAILRQGALSSNKPQRQRYNHTRRIERVLFFGALSWHNKSGRNPRRLLPGDDIRKYYVVESLNYAMKLFIKPALSLTTYLGNKIYLHVYLLQNGDHALTFKAYRLCFSNYLLGRYPNGPGQFIFGAPPLPMASALFPVDYSALNAQPEDLEQYAPDGKTTRRSVIV